MTTVGDIARKLIREAIPERSTALDRSASDLVESIRGLPTRQQLARLKEVICSSNAAYATTPAVQSWALRNSTKIALIHTLRLRGKWRD